MSETFRATVSAENGLHLVPASKIVTAAKQHGIKGNISLADKQADVLNIFDLMCLAAESGAVLSFELLAGDTTAFRQAIGDILTSV